MGPGHLQISARPRLGQRQRKRVINHARIDAGFPRQPGEQLFPRRGRYRVNRIYPRIRDIRHRQRVHDVCTGRSKKIQRQPTGARRIEYASVSAFRECVISFAKPVIGEADLRRPIATRWPCSWLLRGAVELTLPISSIDLSDKVDKCAKFRRHSSVPLPDKVAWPGLGLVV